MFVQLIIALAAGVAAGTFTGLVPGVHINLVAVILLSISGFFLQYTSPVVLVCFIISMAITHTFVDSVPSIFLGAPDSDTVLAVLPGHKLLLEGKGYEAVKLTVVGSLLCLLLGIMLMPLFVLIFPLLYSLLKDWIGWILLAAVVWLVMRHKGLNEKFWSIFVFASSGLLGIIVLSAESLKEPLLPMLSGIFGTSALLLSLFQNVELPKQTVTDQIRAHPADTIKSLTAGTISGALVALFPGLGPAQAAVISSAFFRQVSTLGYLILVGGINTVNFLVSLATMFTISKARNGAMLAAMQLAPEISAAELLLYITISLIVGGIATFVTIKSARTFSKIISKVNYRIICLGVIIFVSLLVIYFSGIIGIFVLIISTAVGLVPPLTNTSRSHAMGCLLLPVILYFLL